MKTITILLLTIAITASYTLTSQVAINNDESNPDSSAILDVKSTDKGLLIPRMTQVDIEEILSPADGLVVYSTDNKHFYFYDGDANEWKEIAIGSRTINTNCGTITDNSGNIYKTIVIDTQCWIKENLATTKYNDGTDIPHVTDNTAWSNLTTPGYCWYNNDSATYGSTYGALYNWHTVNTGKLCPIGWHVPTDDEWTTLSAYLGGLTVAGGKLKEAGLEHWNIPNYLATNETGFTALPGGGRIDDGTFIEIGLYTYLSSTTEYDSDTDYAWARGMSYEHNDLVRGYIYKRNGLSIRCLKD